MRYITTIVLFLLLTIFLPCAKTADDLFSIAKQHTFTIDTKVGRCSANYLYTIDGNSYFSTAGHVMDGVKTCTISNDSEKIPGKLYAGEFKECYLDNLAELCNCRDWAIIEVDKWTPKNLQANTIGKYDSTSNPLFYYNRKTKKLVEMNVIGTGLEKLATDVYSEDGMSGSGVYDSEGALIGIVTRSSKQINKYGGPVTVVFLIGIQTFPAPEPKANCVPSG